MFTYLHVHFSNLCCLALQTLKALRQIEVINFGDCLVRSKGAVAIADAVKEGLHKLKVLSSCCSAPLKNAKFSILCVSVRSPTATDFFKTGFSSMQTLLTTEEQQVVL